MTTVFPVSSGLTSAEAAARLAADGPNILPPPRHPATPPRVCRDAAAAGDDALLRAAAVGRGRARPAGGDAAWRWRSSWWSCSTELSRSRRRTGPTGPGNGCGS
ncbi:cation-transporting P-type ATPase [Streptosporangium sp. NPDC023825]|uniref:cation-transporting P-type ATPase n=1 Tax=Streptosporangium sp. NPDC023825 TaxID=3154909 RepID=UPI00342F35D1